MSAQAAGRWGVRWVRQVAPRAPPSRPGLVASSRQQQQRPGAGWGARQTAGGAPWWGARGSHLWCVGAGYSGTATRQVSTVRGLAEIEWGCKPSATRKQAVHEFAQDEHKAQRTRWSTQTAAAMTAHGGHCTQTRHPHNRSCQGFGSQPSHRTCSSHYPTWQCCCDTSWSCQLGGQQHFRPSHRRHPHTTRCHCRCCCCGRRHPSRVTSCCRAHCKGQ